MAERYLIERIDRIAWYPESPVYKERSHFSKIGETLSNGFHLVMFPDDNRRKDWAENLINGSSPLRNEPAFLFPFR